MHVDLVDSRIPRIRLARCGVCGSCTVSQPANAWISLSTTVEAVHYRFPVSVVVSEPFIRAYMAVVFRNVPRNGPYITTELKCMIGYQDAVSDRVFLVDADVHEYKRRKAVRRP